MDGYGFGGDGDFGGSYGGGGGGGGNGGDMNDSDGHGGGSNVTENNFLMIPNGGLKFDPFFSISVFFYDFVASWTALIFNILFVLTM